MYLKKKNKNQVQLSLLFSGFLWIIFKKKPECEQERNEKEMDTLIISNNEQDIRKLTLANEMIDLQMFSVSLMNYRSFTRSMKAFVQRGVLRTLSNI